MTEPKSDILQGTLDLMVLRTLDVMGPLHGYGLARRIEQISEDVLQLNQGTIYASLLRLQQRRWISASWGISDNNRKAKFYAITRAGRKQLAAQTENWERIAGVIARLLEGGAVGRCRPGSGSPSRASVACCCRAVWTTTSTARSPRISTYSSKNIWDAACHRTKRRRAAILRFGGPMQVKEHHREHRSLAFVETTMHDIRYAFRSMRKSPAFSLVAIATLAVGIGAGTAVFSFVRAVLLRPLPYSQAERTGAASSRRIR